jgi:hypothetical protein
MTANKEFPFGFSPANNANLIVLIAGRIKHYVDIK